MIKAVIFDLDDTLVSENDYIKSGYRHVSGLLAERYGVNLSKTKSELYELFLENNKNVFNRFMDRHNIAYVSEDILWLVNEYRNHKPDVEFYADVVPVLDELKRKGIKTGIISDGYLSTQRNKAEVLRLYELFDKVIFTEELGREYWKPHPGAFEMMKESLGVEFNEMVYVGDNPQKDFYISKLLPIMTVRIVRTGSVYRTAEYYRGVGETVRIEALQDILKINKG